MFTIPGSVIGIGSMPGVEGREPGRAGPFAIIWRAGRKSLPGLCLKNFRDWCSASIVPLNPGGPVR